MHWTTEKPRESGYYFNLIWSGRWHRLIVFIDIDHDDINKSFSILNGEYTPYSLWYGYFYPINLPDGPTDLPKDPAICKL
jgi:hypothetical protein